MNCERVREFVSTVNEACLPSESGLFHHYKKHTNTHKRRKEYDCTVNEACLPSEGGLFVH